MSRLAIGLLVVMGWSVSAWAVENPAEAIPESAGVVIRLKNTQETSKKLMDFSNQADPGVGFFVAPLIQGMGVVISNQTLEGVDRQGDWWVAVFPSAEEEPGVVFGIRASDADKLEAAVGEGYQFVRSEPWVFYSESEKALQEIKSRLAGDGKSIESRVHDASRAVLERGDLSVFVNLVRLKEIYREQIDRSRERAKELLEQAQLMAGKVTGANTAGAFEAYRAMLDTAYQALEDAESTSAGLTILEDSLELETFTQFAAESSTAERLSKHPTSELELVSRLPKGRLGYFGLSADVDALVQFGMQQSIPLLEGDEESTKKLEALQKELTELEYGSYAAGFGLVPEKQGVVRAEFVTEVKSAEKVRPISREAVGLLKNLPQEGIERSIELKQDAEKYGERTADVLTMKQTFEPSLDPTGEQNKMMELLFGPDGMTERVVYLDDKVAQTLEGGQESMEALLKSVETEGDEGKNADLQKVRSQLSPQANILAFVDLPTLAVQGALVARESGRLELPVDKETLDRLQIEPSYLGTSVTAERQAVRTKLVIPASQLAGILKLGILMQSIRAGQQGGGESP